MTRVYRLNGWTFLLGLILVLALLATLFILSLPLILLLSALSVVGYIYSRIKKSRDPDLIKNNKIGDYKIKQDENDPSVIEVL